MENSVKKLKEKKVFHFFTIFIRGNLSFKKDFMCKKKCLIFQFFVSYQEYKVEKKEEKKF